MTIFAAYGFVVESHGSKQLNILGDNASLGLNGKLLRFGKFERALEGFSEGEFVQGVFTTTKTGTIKFAFNDRFVRFNKKDFFMSEKYYLTVLAVKSQVPQNIKAVAAHFGNSQRLVKIAWVTVAEKGKPYVMPVPLSLVAAKDAALFIGNESNALVGVLNDSGELVYSGEEGVVKPAKVVKAPKVKANVKAPAVIAPVPTGAYFYFEADANLVFSSISANYKSGFSGSVNVLITGPSGTGKTSVAKKFADYMGWSCHRLNCALIVEASDIAGQRAIKNGETSWEWSAAATAIMNGNCVVILDELNRAYPNSLNAMFGLLDDDRATWFNNLELKVGPNVVFVATINEGSEYTGTFQADAALLNRFQYVFGMGNIPTEEQSKILENNGLSADDAKRVVQVGNTINSRIAGVNCSIRTLKAIAAAMRSGMEHREAWEFVLVNRVHESNKRDLVDLLNSSLGHYSQSASSIKLCF